MSNRSQDSHENYNRVHAVKLGSDRAFAITFAVVFAILALFPMVLQHPFKPIYACISLLFLTIAFLKPALLHPFNLLWFKFGLFLNKIVSPVVLGLLFIVAFMPVGLVLKLFKKDILNLKINKQLSTYWIKSALPTSSMKDQF